MTGHIKGGLRAHQKEKIYAILREVGGYVKVYDIVGKCWKSDDGAISSIKPPTVRRCLQELEKNSPCMAKKDGVGGWMAVVP